MIATFYQTSIALMLISLSGGSVAMKHSFSPPFSTVGEKSVDQAHHEFEECKEAFSEVIGSNIVIARTDFTHTETWGYTMRAVYNNLSDSGKILPQSIFICWKRENEPVGIAIAPIDV